MSDKNAYECKTKKIEVVECDSDFEENNKFLREDTPYETYRHYLQDDSDSTDINEETNKYISQDTNEDETKQDTDTNTKTLTVKDLYKPEDKDMMYAPIFLETSLPRKGWIQGCVLCNAKTSNTIFYLDDTYKSFGYMVYCCHFCKRTINRNVEVEIEYTDMIIDYIDTYKDEIYRSMNK